MTQVWPGRVAQRWDRRRLALCAVALLSCLPGADTAVHTVALAQVEQEFEMNSGTAGFAAGIGGLLTVAGLPVAGRIGDRTGRRPMLLAGGAGLVIGCLITAFAIDPVMFVVGRVLTGTAIAALVVTALAVLPGLFFRNELPAVVGMWLAVQSAAVLVCGVSGALLVTGPGWRTGYLLTAVVAVVLVVAGWVVVPAAAPGRRRRDVVGMLLGAAVPVVLFGGIYRVSEIGWRSTPVLAALAAAVALAGVFAWWEFRRPDPVLPVRLFRASPFTAACLAGFACDVAVVAYTLPIATLVAGRPEGAATTALILAVPMYLGMVIGAVLAGSAQDRGVPLRETLIFGLLCCGFGVFLGGCVDVRAESWLYATAGTVVGFGALWTQSAQTALTVGSVPVDRSGSAAALQATVSRLGIALAPLALAAIIAASTGGTTAEESFFHALP
ncbi:MFS transporter, partial [Nocardia wallacei]|uniref:MFS transporter n=1 Tax=Nocardia wallacei TaxID=480035 RepID=UPI002457D7BA